MAPGRGGSGGAGGPPASAWAWPGARGRSLACEGGTEPCHVAVVLPRPLGWDRRGGEERLAVLEPGSVAPGRSRVWAMPSDRRWEEAETPSWGLEMLDSQNSKGSAW